MATTTELAMAVCQLVVSSRGLSGFPRARPLRSAADRRWLKRQLHSQIISRGATGMDQDVARFHFTSQSDAPYGQTRSGEAIRSVVRLFEPQFMSKGFDEKFASTMSRRTSTRRVTRGLSTRQEAQKLAAYRSKYQFRRKTLYLEVLRFDLR